MDPSEIVRALVSMMNDSRRAGPIIEEIDDRDRTLVKSEKRPRDPDTRPYGLDIEDVMGYMLIGVLVMLFIVLLKISNRLG
jgi:hypothetical protein